MQQHQAQNEDVSVSGATISGTVLLAITCLFSDVYEVLCPLLVCFVFFVFRQTMTPLLSGLISVCRGNERGRSQHQACRRQY